MPIWSGTVSERAISSAASVPMIVVETGADYNASVVGMVSTSSGRAWAASRCFCKSRNGVGRTAEAVVRSAGLTSVEAAAPLNVSMSRTMRWLEI